MIVSDAQFRRVVPDEERTAFGLGFEYRRRGRPLDDNPFPAGHWKHEMFTDGWRERMQWERNPNFKQVSE